MSGKLTRRDFLKTAGVASVSLLLSACNISPTENSSQTQGKPTLRIGYLPLTHAALGLVDFAQSAGGKLEKLNLEMVKFTSWPELAEALQSGSIDGADCLLNNLAFVIVAKGVPLQSVLMAVRSGSALTVQKSINTPTDLKGKKIAIPSRYSPHYILLYQYLLDNGLNPDTDLQTIEMAPPDMVQGLASGAIDGFIVAEPFDAQAEELGIGHILAFSRDMTIPGSKNLECGITLRKEFIDRYPDAVQEFVDKCVQAGLWIEQEPEAAANLIAPLIGQKPATVLRALDNPQGRTRFVDLYPRKSEYEALQDYMFKLGLISKKIDMDVFVETRFAEKAYQKFGLTK
jgi:NitT/TauT family transport system substrate-binding protein